jgi:hypothetical protein
MGMGFQNILLVWLGSAVNMDLPPVHDHYREDKGEKTKIK